MNHLVYVSNNAILEGNILNPFFAQEKTWIAENIGDFHLVCPQGVFICKGKDEIKKKYCPTLKHKVLAAFYSIIDKNVYIELRRMIQDNKLTFINVLKIYRFAYQGVVLEQLIRKCISNIACKNVVLYSYWMSYDAYACARMRSRNKTIKAITRAHSYEIQIHRNECNPYLMKHYICSNMDRIAFISKNAMNSFSDYFVIDSKKMITIYVGSTRRDTGYIERVSDNVLTILTCSSVSHVKRLHYLINAIQDWNKGNIKWIHIGDGPLFREIQELAEKQLSRNSHIKYQFMGQLDNREVHKLLKNDTVDVFVNMSESEGVPISIMEAMSVGLPIIAPAIYGIPELVDESCGILFDSSEGISALKHSIELFSNLCLEQRNNMGSASYNIWKEKFCLEKNLSILFQEFIENNQ